MKLGRICCRFEDGSENLKLLGEVLYHKQRAEFQPYFEVSEHQGNSTKKVKIIDTVSQGVIAKSFTDCVGDCRYCENDISQKL